MLPNRAVADTMANVFLALLILDPRRWCQWDYYGFNFDAPYYIYISLSLSFSKVYTMYRLVFLLWDIVHIYYDCLYILCFSKIDTDIDMNMCIHNTCFFLTCQVRLARFYVSCTPSPPRPPPLRPPPLPDLICKRFAVVPAGPQLQARDRSGPRWERSPSDLNCKREVAVVPAGLEQQAPDQSGPCRTRTASSWSQWSPPGLNSKLSIALVPARPEQLRIRTVPAEPKRYIPVVPAEPEQQAPDKMSEYMSDRLIDCQNISQIECQNISQIECLNIMWDR